VRRQGKVCAGTQRRREQITSANNTVWWRTRLWLCPCPKGALALTPWGISSLSSAGRSCAPCVDRLLIEKYRVVIFVLGHRPSKRDGVLCLKSQSYASQQKLFRRSLLQFPEPARSPASAKQRSGNSSRMGGLLRCARQAFVAPSYHTRVCGSYLRARAPWQDRSAAMVGAGSRLSRNPR
jgi:hypothetical protein